MLLLRELLQAALTRATRKFNARVNPDAAARVHLSGAKHFTLGAQVGHVRTIQQLDNQDPDRLPMPCITLPGRRLAEAMRGFEAETVAINTLAGDRSKVGELLTIEFRCGARRFTMEARVAPPLPELGGSISRTTPIPQNLLLEALQAVHHTLDHQGLPLTLRGKDGCAHVTSLTRTGWSDHTVYYLTGDDLQLGLPRTEADVLMDFLTPTADPELKSLWHYVEAKEGKSWRVELPGATLVFPVEYITSLHTPALGEKLGEAEVLREKLDGAVQYVIRTHRTEQIDPYVSLTFTGDTCEVTHRSDGMVAREEFAAKAAKSFGLLVNANLLRRALNHAGYMPTLRSWTSGEPGVTTPLLEIIVGGYRTILAATFV
jgi:hypothetical protein